MKDILFYIFSSITLLAAFYIAFFSGSRNSFRAAMYLFTGIAGLFVLLNFHLFGLIIVLLLLMLFSGEVLLEGRISGYITEADIPLRSNFLSIVLIGIFTAVLAAMPGAAKWPQFGVMHEINTLSLIFSKYIAAVLAIGFLISVVISSAAKLLRNGANE